MATANPDTATRHSPAAQPKRRRANWLLPIGVLCIALAAAAAWWFHEKSQAAAHKKASNANQDASASEEEIAVDIIHPSRGGIVRTVTQIGSVHSFEWAELFAKISGYLAKQHVDYGSKVKQGDLLAVIDDPEVVKEAERAAAAVKQAKAAVEQARARIETAKADAMAAEAMIEQSKADIDTQVATRTYEELKLERYRALVARQAETQQVVDEQQHHTEAAKAAEKGARAALMTARAQFSAAQAKVDSAQADYEEAKAKVDVDESTLARNKVFVDYTQIRSPYTGVITKRNFFPGAFIRSAAEGATLPLLVVARTDVMRIITMVPDLDVPHLDVGDPAEVSIDALGNEIFKGKVSRFSYMEDPTSRTMHTEIDIPNPDGRLKEGMYGIAKITLGVAEHALTIPAKALVGESHGGKAEVYIVKNGKAFRAQIQIGANDGIRVQVDSGLTAEDQVIINTNAITNGAPVRPRTTANPGDPREKA